MTIADLIQNIIDSSKERIKNPILGTFICSFIVYNWRPLFLLMFSKKSIEENILIINEQHCTSASYLKPLAFAFIYNILFPFVMILVDKMISYAKRQRLVNIYTNKSDELTEKIKLAEKVLELKNAESGNKEKQELLDQIESLKESNSQLIITHKNTVDQLNASLKEANTSFINYVNEENKKKEKKAQEFANNLYGKKDKASVEAVTLFSNMSEDDRSLFQAMVSPSGYVMLDGFDDKSIAKMIDFGLFEKGVEKNKWQLTEIGKALHLYITYFT